MSVFRGNIAEYPGVVVDRYVPVNCERGRVFFLSHCHKDHMNGLGSRALIDALRRRGTHLYCSEVTRTLLHHYTEFQDLIPFLKALPMEEPVSMTLETTVDLSAQQVIRFTVTLLPAGHCPGSVMFMFEGTNGTVLYTGDFRLTVDETKRIQALHPGGKLLDITALYLDTTFCTPLASDIPDRDTSRQCVLSCAADWLARSPQNVVLLQCSMFGYEHIFMGVFQKLCTKVHVGSWRLGVYSEIPAVQECLTGDGQSTRVHCCSHHGGQKRPLEGLPCGSRSPNSPPPQVLTIKPSMQWFLNKSFLPDKNMYRIMHSMHASFSEICSFVGYLQPLQIVPCVVPIGDSALSDVHKRLKVFLSGSLMQRSPSVMGNQEVGEEEEEGEERECSSESDPEWQGERKDDIGDGVVMTKCKPNKKCSSPVLVLPAMLTDGGHSPNSPEGVESVGTGGTLGSLEQTPIDLYLSCDSSQETGSELIAIERNNSARCDGLDGKPVVPNNNTNGKPVKPAILDNSEGISNVGNTIEGLLEPDTGPQSFPKDLTNGMKELPPPLLLNVKGEVQSPEKLDHRQRRHSSVEIVCNEDREPQAKRSRLSCHGTRKVHISPCSHVGQHSVDTVPHPSSLHSVRDIVLIDLTKDDENDDSDSSREDVQLFEGDQGKDDLEGDQSDDPEGDQGDDLEGDQGDDDPEGDLDDNDPEDIIVLSGSSSSSVQLVSVHGGDSSGDEEVLTGSPEYLPPTPGRERVNSILKRRNLGFL